MKIVEDTPNRLVLTSTPWFHGLVFTVIPLIGVGILIFGTGKDPIAPILGVLFIGAGLFFLALVHRLRMTFDRVRGTAEIVRIRRTNEVTTVPLSNVAEVGVDGDDEAQRLTIICTDGTRHPLMRYGYTGGDHERVRARLNAWLAETA